MNGLFRNNEGYYDPTAGIAMARISHREVKGKTTCRRPLVYICSPYAGNIARNTAAARRYCRFAVDHNAIPVASHLLYPQFMDDTDPDERALGLLFGKILMSKCSEVWVFSDGVMSHGMKSECDYAARKGLKIRRFRTDCREVTG